MTQASDPIAAAWAANAALWTRAVREGRIASRRAGTDAALLAAIADCGAQRLLDVGCGEGWLVRAVAAQGCRATGVDGSTALVEAARRADPDGDYRVIDYAALVAGAADLADAAGDFDAAVFNYALFDEAAGAVLAAVRPLIAPGGALVLQTLHPWSSVGAAPYRDGWRTEAFAGFGDDGRWTPMPWYFRTLESWLALVEEAGFGLETVREPAESLGGPPLSLLIVARR